MFFIASTINLGVPDVIDIVIITIVGLFSILIFIIDASYEYEKNKNILKPFLYKEVTHKGTVGKEYLVIGYDYGEMILDVIDVDEKEHSFDYKEVEIVREVETNTSVSTTNV